MSLADPDEQRTRFRRPLGVAVMAYKAILGLSEIVVGLLLAIPSFDPQATFARLSAEELREDPGDRFVALVSRHLPGLLHHRGLVAVGLIVFGLAKLVAAAAMWEGPGMGRLPPRRDSRAAPTVRCSPSRHLPNGRPCFAGSGERGGASGADHAPSWLAAGSAIWHPSHPRLAGVPCVDAHAAHLPEICQKLRYTQPRAAP